MQLSMNRRVAPGGPPASSPSVPLADDPGAETTPKLAAGTAALRGQVRDPDAFQKEMLGMNSAGTGSTPALIFRMKMGTRWNASLPGPWFRSVPRRGLTLSARPAP